MKTEKQCHLCKVVQPVSNFYTSKNHNDGFQSRCIPCEKKYAASRRHLYVERQRVLKRKWRAENKERDIESNRAYRNAHPEIWYSQARKREAKMKQNQTFKISKKELKKLYRGPCAYCNATRKMTLDHVVPIFRGGSHSIGNLVPACGNCNFSKGKKLLMEWKLYLRERASNG